MEDAEGVSGLKAVGNLDSDREHELQAGRPTGDEPVERLPGDVLHDDVALIAAFADFVDGADVGVLDGGGEPGFAQYGGTELLCGEDAGAQDLSTTGRCKSESFAR